MSVCHYLPIYYSSSSPFSTYFPASGQGQVLLELGTAADTTFLPGLTVGFEAGQEIGGEINMTFLDTGNLILTPPDLIVVTSTPLRGFKFLLVGFTTNLDQLLTPVYEGNGSILSSHYQIVYHRYETTNYFINPNSMPAMQIFQPCNINRSSTRVDSTGKILEVLGHLPSMCTTRANVCAHCLRRTVITLCTFGFTLQSRWLWLKVRDRHTDLQ